LAEEEGMQQGGWQGGRFGDCSELVIGACMRVHSELGPGLLESAYEACLAFELNELGLQFQRQVNVPVVYRNVSIEGGYRIDFVVEKQLVVEIKAVERVLPVHVAQVITYLKLTRLPTGLLVNFHTASLRHGIRRITIK
jgi:GxxExxY protein